MLKVIDNRSNKTFLKCFENGWTNGSYNLSIYILVFSSLESIFIIYFVRYNWNGTFHSDGCDDSIVRKVNALNVTFILKWRKKRKKKNHLCALFLFTLILWFFSRFFFFIFKSFYCLCSECMSFRFILIAFCSKSFNSHCMERKKNFQVGENWVCNEFQ